MGFLFPCGALAAPPMVDPQVLGPDSGMSTGSLSRSSRQADGGEK